MNSPKTESPSSLDPGFSLVAGALAGFIIAFELSLLELLVWATGSYAGMDYKAFACMSLQSTARVVLGLLVAGIVGGLLWTALLRIVPAIRRLATQSALSLWVLGSFVYSVFGSVSVAPRSIWR